MESILTLVVGCVVLSVATIASGGAFLLRTQADQERTPIQRTFFRAGHAHAGVLVTLGLLLITVQRTSGVAPPWQWAAVGTLVAAILIPIGFFCSVWQSGSTTPNGWIACVWIGAVFLVASVVAVGISLVLVGAAELSG